MHKGLRPTVNLSHANFPFGILPSTQANQRADEFPENLIRNGFNSDDLLVRYILESFVLEHKLGFTFTIIAAANVIS